MSPPHYSRSTVITGAEPDRDIFWRIGPNIRLAKTPLSGSAPVGRRYYSQDGFRIEKIKPFLRIPVKIRNVTQDTTQSPISSSSDK